MTVPTLSPNAASIERATAEVLTSKVGGRRRLTDGAATAMLSFSFAAAVVPLALVIWYMVAKGGSAVTPDYLP